MDEQRESETSRNRLATLVDGIFAFAMTLLVTGLVIPRFSKTEAEAQLANSLASMHSELISFLVSFFVLALAFAFSFVSPSWSMAVYLLIIPGIALLKRCNR
ncbi:MAG: TMEM175 family protein [Deltaproteobacteria bacterium]|nr:TMEM175 family protein [Deltaproteobacteria bacterium]